MSRSRRNQPILGHTSAETDHPWKKQVSRRLRHRVKQALNQTLDGDVFAGKPWDLDSEWSSAKDGKSYYAKVDPRRMRK